MWPCSLRSLEVGELCFLPQRVPSLLAGSTYFGLASSSLLRHCDNNVTRVEGEASTAAAGCDNVLRQSEGEGAREITTTSSC